MRFTLVQAGLGARHGLRRCPHPSGFGSRERLGISHCQAKVPRRYWAGNSHPVWFGWCPLTACAQARVVVWVTCQEALCPHGSPMHLWLEVPWRDMTWQAKADNGGLKRRLWDLEKALQQAREDKRDIHEGEGRGGRGQWDRCRDPTPWCCFGKPAKLTPPLLSALTAQPQTTLLLANPAPSHAVSMQRLWTWTPCTPDACTQHRQRRPQRQRLPCLQKSLPCHFR